MNTTKKVNERLDELILEFFSNLEEIYQTQELLDDEMKNGFLHMSRARYNMGAKSISPSQYDENKMTASVKVDIVEGNSGTDVFIINSSVSSDMTKVSTADSESDTSVETLGIRKRNITKSEQENAEDLKDDSSTQKLSTVNKDQSSKIQYSNPLNWFGVLVPQSLRQSQTSFKKAVDHSVKIANLKMKILRLRKDYQACMAEKLQSIKLDD